MPTLRTHGPAVNAPRPYDASRRRLKASRSHSRVIDAAETRFLRDGYAPTTIGSIAADAGVSVDTVYKTFGGKPGLIRAIHDRALRGVGPVPAETRSDELQMTERDPRRIIRRWGEFVVELAPLGAPIALLVRDAAGSDAELRSVRDELDRGRLERMTVNARRLHRMGCLRPGITIQRAARILWAFSSAEMYELMVVRGGMPLKEYGVFVAEAMIAALL